MKNRVPIGNPPPEMTSLFLFAHQDDELAAMAHLARAHRLGEEVHCLFLTDGATRVSSSERNAETTEALARHGIGPLSIDFIGTREGFADGRLVERLDAALAAVLASTRTLRISSVWTLAWEGGHPDHDATHLVALAVARHLGIDSVLAVPIYHGGGTRGRRFRAFHTKSESARAVDIPFAEGLRIVRNMFDYRSQRMVMLGLAPSLLMHALVRRSFEYVAVDPAVVPVRPHPGPLLYERARRATSWSDFARVASAFCARELGAPLA